jgi:hypothetical protein
MINTTGALLFFVQASAKDHLATVRMVLEICMTCLCLELLMSHRK